MKEIFDIAKLDSWINDLNQLSNLTFKSDFNELEKENLLFKIDKLKEFLCKEYQNGNKS